MYSVDFADGEWSVKAAGLFSARLAGMIPNFRAERFVDAPEPYQVEVCEQWIAKNAHKVKNVVRDRNSYSLKHTVERTMEHLVYVSNGAFIQAAVNLGYTVYVEPNAPTNCYFNMSIPKKILYGR